MRLHYVPVIFNMIALLIPLLLLLDISSLLNGHNNNLSHRIVLICALSLLGLSHSLNTPECTLRFTHTEVNTKYDSCELKAFRGIKISPSQKQILFRLLRTGRPHQRTFQFALL